MNNLRKLFLALIFVFAVVFLVADVSAQDVADESPAPEVVETTKIFNKTRNTQKIADLKILYRDQIEAYRNSEKEFNIAKTHYFNVETLTSLEEAVAATDLVMKNRLKVLITYLELLGTTLEDASGVELALKEESLKQINSSIMSLKLHQEDTVLAKDRAAVNLLADNFEVFVEPYNQVTYRALSLIRIGQIQSVYDAAVIIDSDIKKDKEGDDIGAVVEAKRDRAYQEIQRNFTITNSGLKMLNNRIIEGKDDGFGRSFYEKTLDELEPIYIQMSKSLDHLEELLRL